MITSLPLALISAACGVVITRSVLNKPARDLILDSVRKSIENNLNESEKDKLINQIKLEMVSSRFIDDHRFAETKVRTIRRQGGSKRLIFAKLNEKGISKDVIQSALNTVDANHENAEIIAAVNFIKKKKKGVFYNNPKISDEINTYTLKDKWYGSLARRGFSLEIVKKVLEIEDINDAHLILEGNVL